MPDSDPLARLTQLVDYVEGGCEPEEPEEVEMHSCAWCCDEEPVEDDRFTTAYGTAGEILLCDTCYDDSADCRECENRFPSGELTDMDQNGYDYYWVCRECIRQDFTRCTTCDEWQREEYLAQHIREEHSADFIHDYFHKPLPRFHHAGWKVGHSQERRTVYTGFELEMEAKVCDVRDAKDIVEGLEGLAYAKHDGSLDDGLELVTHPMTLGFINENFPFEHIETLRKLGFRSWNTSTCGMHIHVNRSAFGGKGAKDEQLASHLWRFTQLIVDNAPDVTRFAGRLDTSYATFSDQRATTSKVIANKLDRWGARRCPDRMAAVNLCNEHTVEVRIFKGTMRVHRVRANLEMVHAAVEYTRDLTYGDVIKQGALSWIAFHRWVRQHTEEYPYLAALMAQVIKDRKEVSA